MKGVQIIGTFHPVNLPDKEKDYDQFREDLVQAWRTLYGGRIEVPHVRIPVANASESDSCSWHHDCGDWRPRAAPPAVLFWSNAIPIQFKRTGSREYEWHLPECRPDTGKGCLIWSPRPWQVVLFDNSDPDLKHRRPQGITLEDNRWSIIDRRYDGTTYNELRKEFLKID